MSITIDLNAEQQERIAAEARKRGMSIEQYTLGVLLGEYPPLHEEMTPAEILETLEREGVIPMGQDRSEDSVTLANTLRYPNAVEPRSEEPPFSPPSYDELEKFAAEYDDARENA